jgi:hypothetical protein
LFVVSFSIAVVRKESGSFGFAQDDELRSDELRWIALSRDVQISFANLGHPVVARNFEAYRLVRVRWDSSLRSE